MRGEGSASELRGHVCVEHIFVDDAYSQWTKQLRSKSLLASKLAFAYLQKVAKSRSIELFWHEQETQYTSEVEVPTSTDDHSWTKAAVGASANPLGLYLLSPGAPAVPCDHRLALLHVAKVGRSYAQPKGYSYDSQMERAVVFLRRLEVSQFAGPASLASIMVPERPASFVHELLHIFGAEDLYKPAARAHKAKMLYPNDVMLQSHRALEYVEIADYTAHGIGWTDKEPPALPSAF